MPNALDTVRSYFPEVKHVEDAKRGAMVEVTNRDLASALRRTHKTCAMAVACKRKMDLDGGYWVSLNYPDWRRVPIWRPNCDAARGCA